MGWNWLRMTLFLRWFCLWLSLLMSYRIYHTEGLVLGSYPSREADRVFKILTPNLGVIFCLATGIRKEKSKFRYCLQTGRFVKNVALVKGKDTWRLIHAENNSEFGQIYRNLSGRVVLSKVTILLKRMIHGEIANHNLYEDIKQAFLVLESSNSLNNFFMNILESLLVLKIISRLGYEPKDTDLSSFVREKQFDENTIREFQPFERKAILFINQALQASHL